MKTNSSRRVLAGLILITIGAILLMRWMGVLPFTLPFYVFTWQMILIVLGVVFMLTEKNKTTGLILFLIGAVFISRDIFGVSLGEVLRIAIPFVFLIAGIFILMPRKKFSKGRINRIESDDALDSIDEVNIFSGGNKYINSRSFKGGEVTCIFGGSEISFKNADLAKGINVVDVTCIFGGFTFYVPEDWTVKTESTVLFAGFSDSRTKSNPHLVTDPEKVLLIRGTLLFGGGEIKPA